MYKIYYGSKSLIIQGQTEEINHNKDAMHFSFSADGLDNVLEALEGTGMQSYIITVKDEEEALNALKKRYRVLPAGGGLVYTSDAHVLLIFRRGKWDLPKGKLDKGEDIDQCAIREVEEETGLLSPILKEKILITYHTYSEKEKDILKESHWYLMYVNAKQDLQPQTEEDIEICEWVHLNDVHRYKENMHPSVIDVLEKGVQLIKL